MAQPQPNSHHRKADCSCGFPRFTEQMAVKQQQESLGNASPPSQKTVSQLYNVQALACPDTKANHISQHVASRSQREVNDPTITSSGKRPGAVMKSLECDGAAPPAQDDDACKRGMGRSNGVKFGESEIQAELRRTASASLPTSWGLLQGFEQLVLPAPPLPLDKA
eukprot:CAMPEP_0174355360 /NCGR_PEP_ID=MMETSP0811_2-20130205/24511_1 /TAXON_ID=73025 ORGANISM="Eutreptiella gymnastica-like, Strain CCMP1594" /NCGR_SAMPLE_ID=MMETSP0811_2 /ASSEMBLY_ACC=CAM_ASM_000667 /LENGTH=165 /DNA_ID=CAMNT_0015486689 /DNA_START=470 /DNA_END=966 /DNA_ORIENTATION=-